MEIQGHVHNGIIVPLEPLTLSEGTLVTITVRPEDSIGRQQMSDEERSRYLAALARIDGVENENPGDTFSGADLDRELYGSGL